MLTTAIVSCIIAGMVTMLWQRIIAATDSGRLSWLFIPIEAVIGNQYNSSVRSVVGFILWVVIGAILALPYWFLVEHSVLTYYDGLSVSTYVFFIYCIDQLAIMPLFRMGVGGWRYSKWLWLESVFAWLIFGLVFWLLVAL